MKRDRIFKLTMVALLGVLAFQTPIGQRIGCAAYMAEPVQNAEIEGWYWFNQGMLALGASNEVEDSMYGNMSRRGACFRLWYPELAAKYPHMWR